MKSTGEVIGYDAKLHRAMYKALPEQTASDLATAAAEPFRKSRREMFFMMSPFVLQPFPQKNGAE